MLFLVKKQPCQQVINWIDAQEESSLFISIITMAEIKKGIVRIEKSQPSRYQKFQKLLQTLEQRFTNRILPLNENILNDRTVILIILDNAKISC
ncbi:MAG TPA: hypothetical protein VK203_04435 [Nostocaceae cyanobacterium]|nr:hypothetical protein [Nostocaceae cyanobacterium]